jgi:hypothetical protein
MNAISHYILNPLKGAAILALAAGTFTLTPAKALAGDQVPFKTGFDTVAHITVNFPIASVAVVGGGLASHLGAMTLETTDQTVNLITQLGTATYYFTAANGDVIEAKFFFTSLPTATGVSLDGVWTITGGTGRFVGASGSGTTQGRVDFTGPDTGVGHVTMDGTLSSPGSR